jgi:predicted transposase YbfD/YdcC
VNTTGWLKGLQVTGDGTGIVSHAGVALIRALADNIGLTAGLSQALASRRLLIHDRGRVLADLACAIADGAEVISDFRVMGDQEELFGRVASVPTAWRTLTEIASGGDRPLGKITAAVNVARRRAWAQAAARHGALPGVLSRARRTVKAALAPAWIGFDGAAQVAQLRRTVTAKGKKTVEVVYLITSDRHADPATLAAWVRSHREIENRLHWVRDVTYQEDKSLVRTRNAPRVMASLRSLAISLLRLDGQTNIAAANRHHARDPQRTLKLLQTA